MNYKAVKYTVGQIFKSVAALLVIPFITSALYGELADAQLLLVYIVTALVLLSLGCVLTKEVPDDKNYYAREGILTVGLSWIAITLIGTLPLMFGNYGKELYESLTFFDWLFETASGFSTTGATVLSGAQIEGMSRGLLMWRSLTHWIGGMGILVFILALAPASGGSGMQMMQNESTGFSVSKLVGRTTLSAKILYIMYTTLTLLQFIFLVCSQSFKGGTDAFHALILSFSTAGTGGFSASAGSVGDFNAYVQTVVGVFMLLFGINFTLFFLVLVGRWKDALKSEELRFYIIVILASLILISINLWLGESKYETFWIALPYAAFTTVSVITTTGFDITASSGFVDSGSWPAFSIAVLLVLMFIGGCAGSTSGGFKCSRALLLLKAAWASLKSALNPNAVYVVRLDGKKVEDKVISGVANFFALYMIIVVAGAALVALDPAAGLGEQPIIDALMSVMTCLGNVGPKLTEIVGASSTFVQYAPATKVLFSAVMLIGRLEIYPMLLLFAPKTYSRKY